MRYSASTVKSSHIEDARKSLHCVHHHGDKDISARTCGAQTDGFTVKQMHIGLQSFQVLCAQQVQEEFSAACE